jgi:methionyl-tRNA formyltransferase
MKVVFMGTPDFAEAALRALAASDHTVVGVVSAPDKPVGRGHQIARPAVAEAAVELGIALAQPVKLRDPEFLEWLADKQADVFCVVAFRMLPAVVWQMPSKGTINIHGSLLPFYRGAAPIQHAVARGETITGVTSFFIREEIDTGAVLLQRGTAIEPDDTAGSVYARLMHEGALLLVDTLDALACQTLHGIPQSDLISLFENEGRAFHDAPKLFRADGEINWDRPATAVDRFIRGMTPHPGVWTMLNGKPLKVHAAVISQEKTGEYDSDRATGICRTEQGRLWVQTLDGEIELLNVQAAGKPRRDVADFLNGYRHPIEELG